MRVSSSAAVRSNAGYEARSVAPSSAGSGTLQWTSSGVDGNCGADLANAVAQRDHRVEPLGAELVEVLGSVSRRCRCPYERRTRTAFGCSDFGWLPALAASTDPADMCSSSASAIWDRALLPVHRNSTRGRRRELRARGHSAAQPRDATTGAAHRPRLAAPRGRRRGRWRSSCRGDPPSCVARSRARRRGAGAGGTTPSSAARRSAPSTPARSDRSARALATTATAADATPAARIVAVRRRQVGCDARPHDLESSRHARYRSIPFDGVRRSAAMLSACRDHPEPASRRGRGVSTVSAIRRWRSSGLRFVASIHVSKARR